jgi:hypothetical protein
MKKRIVMLLSVVALMVVMLAMSVAPSFAITHALFRCALPNDPANSVAGFGGQFKQDAKAAGYTECHRER